MNNANKIKKGKGKKPKRFKLNRFNLNKFWIPAGKVHYNFEHTKQEL